MTRPRGSPASHRSSRNANAELTGSYEGAISQLVIAAHNTIQAIDALPSQGVSLIEIKNELYMAIRRVQER